MQEVFARVTRELFDIPLSVLRGIRDEIWFPKRSLSKLDSLQKEMKSRFGMIRFLQDQVSVQSVQINKGTIEKARKDTLLDQKSKECEALKKKVASLEFALMEATNRNKRRR